MSQAQTHRGDEAERRARREGFVAGVLAALLVVVLLSTVVFADFVLYLIYWFVNMGRIWSG